MSLDILRRWPEPQPYTRRRHPVRHLADSVLDRRPDALRAARGICLGAVLGAGITVVVGVLGMVVWRGFGNG